MFDGIGPSQLCGVFHGLVSMLSGSSVAQPARSPVAPATSRANKIVRRMLFIKSIKDQVAFHDFAAAPGGEDVGDALGLFHAGDLDFANELAVAGHHHDA